MSTTLGEIFQKARREVELGWALEEQREIELTEQEKWARDPVGWINEFVYVQSFLTDDPEGRENRPVKIRLFPAQVATIAAWIDLEHLALTGEVKFRNVVIDKTRQIGETVALAALICWLLHHHRVTGLCMHLKLAKIADVGGSWETLFGKVKYIDQRLDRKRLPYLGRLTFRNKPAQIESTIGCVVHGKGQEDDPGRGDSLDFAVVDEAANIEHGELVHQSLAVACPVGKVYLSTPAAIQRDNMHARIATRKPKGWTYLRLHWSEHPVYSIGAHVAGEDTACVLCAGTRAGVRWEETDPRSHRYAGKLTSPWYEKEITDKPDEAVASEYDIDREASLRARVFTEFQTERHVVAGGIPVDFDPDSLHPLIDFEMAWDYGLDATSVVVIQNAPTEVRVIGLLEMGDLFGSTATPERVSERLREYLRSLGLPSIETDPNWTRHLRCIGDPAGQNRETATAKPLVNQYRLQGFNIQKPPARLTARVEINVSAVKRLLLGSPKPLRVCGVNAADFAEHMLANVYPTDATGNRVLGAVKPKDTVDNHACRAFAYWCVATFPPPDALARGSSPEEPEPGEPGPLAQRREAAVRRQRAWDDEESQNAPFDGDVL